MTDVKHFEHLWEESEKVISRSHKDKSTNELVVLITDLLEDYKKLDASEMPDEIKISLRKRYMGEIVFLITGISVKDNINVYAALAEELAMSSL